MVKVTVRMGGNIAKFAAILTAISQEMMQGNRAKAAARLVRILVLGRQ